MRLRARKQLRTLTASIARREDRTSFVSVFFATAAFLFSSPPPIENVARNHSGGRESNELQNHSEEEGEEKQGEENDQEEEDEEDDQVYPAHDCRPSAVGNR